MGVLVFLWISDLAKIEIKDLEQIAATKAKVRFGELLHETSVDGKKYVVNRQGKPVSVILSYKEYQRLLEKSGVEKGNGGE